MFVWTIYPRTVSIAFTLRFMGYFITASFIWCFRHLFLHTCHNDFKPDKPNRTSITTPKMTNSSGTIATYVQPVEHNFLIRNLLKTSNAIYSVIKPKIIYFDHRYWCQLITLDFRQSLSISGKYLSTLFALRGEIHWWIESRNRLKILHNEVKSYLCKGKLTRSKLLCRNFDFVSKARKRRIDLDSVSARRSRCWNAKDM